MKKEDRNRNWIARIALGLSVIAIALSLYSIHNSNSASLQKTLEVCISIMGIGITVILGIQIYTILTIDRRVQEKIENERKLYKDDNSQLKEDLKCFARTMQRFTTGNIYIANEEYNEAFCVFCLAAIDANKLGERELVSISLQQAVNILQKTNCINKSEIVMKHMDELKTGMIGISDEKAITVYNALLNLPSYE
ncbi:hypothetical protein POY69_09805 [Phocaeicola vulgatus]|uniref:hypothetical protein n=1 Tax=Phocaeicola vulgatus TaxID=821 RepID=UPI00189C212B|nr:hypothetical protein [Phocaeicola vulgatus]MDB0752591.1 hypothetical protein [Phocaeicola vulgatus]MDB0764308.1 hypothetical protein [Phocaeicola vulgatus]MDB0768873.1 hypothetical protein [Phocaeicola vulgatus]MDC1694071.1 hypothetical protein [Phocaeicola vulgatus]